MVVLEKLGPRACRLCYHPGWQFSYAQRRYRNLPVVFAKTRGVAGDGIGPELLPEIALSIDILTVPGALLLLTVDGCIEIVSGKKRRELVFCADRTGVLYIDEVRRTFVHAAANFHRDVYRPTTPTLDSDSSSEGDRNIGGELAPRGLVGHGLFSAGSHYLGGE